MLYAQTAKQFVQDAYQLISASSPTVPLQGNDMAKGIHFLNNLLKYYSSSSLMLTISTKIMFTIQIGQLFATFGDPSYVPTPNVTVGRLVNFENAWLELDGVDYPLIDESRNVFFGSYKFFPQLGLPRFVILVNETNLTSMQFYPGPSQQYNVWVYGKFQLAYISENADMSSLPQYYQRFLLFALARDLAFFKGRSVVWDQKLEAMYQEAKDDMESVSSVNLVIDTANESYLNGSWRIRAGI